MMELLGNRAMFERCQQATTPSRFPAVAFVPMARLAHRLSRRDPASEVATDPSRSLLHNKDGTRLKSTHLP